MTSAVPLLAVASFAEELNLGELPAGNAFVVFGFGEGGCSLCVGGSAPSEGARLRGLHSMEALSLG